MWDHRYRQLEEGETVQEGDEVEISNDGWRDPPKWVKATGSIGHKAPCPHYPSHRKFRRLKSKEGRDHE